MGESDDQISPLAGPPPDSPLIPPEIDRITQAFWGPNGIRAGWRLLIFIAICCAILSGAAYLSRSMSRGQASVNPFQPDVLLAGELTGFAIVLVATWIMSKLEGRTIGDYGLPWKRAFRSGFWIGTASGFAAISLLLGALGIAGVFHTGELSLHGAELWKYAGLWACALLAVGFFEEFTFRGYALFTLSTGISFWPAALICSTVFGCIHLTNSRENPLGAFSAGAIGLLFCVMLRRTGDLWMPIGFHAAWDWGETYFYGVPDSGQVTPGRLFNARLEGPPWLSGGTVGPEASWLCILLIFMLILVFSLWLKGEKYPNPASIPDPRRSE